MRISLEIAATPHLMYKEVRVCRVFMVEDTISSDSCVKSWTIQFRKMYL